jgi:hypothetical protein
VLLAPGWVRCERHVVPHNVAFVVAVGVVLEVLARIARTDGTGARLAHLDLQLAAAGRRSSTRNGLRPLGGCLAQRNVRGGARQPWFLEQVFAGQEEPVATPHCPRRLQARACARSSRLGGEADAFGSWSRSGGRHEGLDLRGATSSTAPWSSVSYRRL